MENKFDLLCYDLLFEKGDDACDPEKAGRFVKQLLEKQLLDGMRFWFSSKNKDAITSIQKELGIISLQPNELPESFNQDQQ